ncbi:sigma-70 family RNA polymerase sigma factor [Tepidamorphus sp. 3E244]|uniref:sigma-70 family RNA polymerase sigma factor n=1 Tax=Tepidamorphus sp. 3E244 TaxID=3385498 RepID=UPI0038FD222E
MLAAIGTGDERAFRALMDRHLDRVHAVAMRFCGSQADAEDIAQEAFMRVWRKASGFRPDKAKVTTWLHAIVANLCIDHGRRRRWKSWLPLGDNDDFADSGPLPETVVADRDELARVSRAIRRLPDRQRMALVLSVTGGHSNGEVGDILGISTGAVEQALFRARKTLKEQFDDRL